MLKRLLLPVFIFSCLALAAQVPAGYYDSAYTGGSAKTCAVLKTALFKILSKDTVFISYNSANGTYDSQNAVNNIDRRRNDDNTADIIWDMYTDNPTGAELYTFTPILDECGSSFPPVVGACYNREHAFPRSWFSDNVHIRADMHNIYATDGETNARHANFPYAEVGSTEWSSPAGAKRGTSSFPGYNGTVFEVIDEYKGDFARTMFYMVTAYENFIPAWITNQNADSVLSPNTWPSLDNWAIKQWYKWHIQDPVSQKELTRNDSVFRIQRNRNPYIDHPEFVALVWQCTGLLPVTITAFTAVKNNNDVLLQWKVSSETNFRHYQIERSTDGVSFNSIGTVAAQNRSSYDFTDNNLPAAKVIYYRLKMVDADGRFTYSRIVTIKLTSKSGFSIYPNPASNDITIALQQLVNTVSIVRITDIAGKELLRQTISPMQSNSRIAVQHLPAGRYFVSVISNGTVLHDSFVKMK